MHLVTKQRVLLALQFYLKITSEISLCDFKGIINWLCILDFRHSEDKYAIVKYAG